MATTEDWAKLETAAQVWGQSRCIIDLRRRVEALEQRALTAPEPSAAEPAPAPAADRPLWEVMRQARRVAKAVESSIASRYAAEIDAVADWLDARAVGVDAIVALHAEARRAREGA